MQQTHNLHTILLYAQQEAQRLGNSEILPDHLMLGILRLADGKAFELLMQAGLNPVELKRSIDERLMQSTTSGTTKMSRARGGNGECAQIYRHDSGGGGAIERCSAWLEYSYIA